MPVELNFEIILILAILGVTIFLFVTELFRIDFTAIIVMVSLGIINQFPNIDLFPDPSDLFAGFSSNAVLSIIAVMIIGAGLDKTGLMSKVAAVILKHGGRSEARIVPIVSSTVGFISSFMQNVGAAALFLPVVSRISVRTEIPLSRLLMPMGFCAILGGTMTMVGSSPLILLNDLIISSNQLLPADLKMETFSLFSVTPIGVCLVVTGILYFVFLGRWVLPNVFSREAGSAGYSVRDYLKNIYGLKSDLVEVVVPEGSILRGHTFADIMVSHNLYIVGSYHRGQRWFTPVIDTVIEDPCRLAVLGRRKVIQRMADDFGLEILPELDIFSEAYAPTVAGIAEVVIPPDSSLIDKRAREVRMRKTYGLGLLAIHRGGETLSLVETKEHEATEIAEVPLKAGDTLVSFTAWDNLARLEKSRDFVVVTSDYPKEELRPNKVTWALLFFCISLFLILFTDLKLSLALLTGACGMIALNVLRIDEAYEAVSWPTVFLLASLIPLGQAVQNTGTAEWIAQNILLLLDGWPIWGLQAVLAVLATAFTLVMSNVGATVLLFPLAVSIALASGANPAIFALTVAISTSNSFLIPTHQVNALIMGPGGYKVTDFMKGGGIMTILFLVVSLAVMNCLF